MILTHLVHALARYSFTRSIAWKEKKMIEEMMEISTQRAFHINMHGGCLELNCMLVYLELVKMEIFKNTLQKKEYITINLHNLYTDYKKTLERGCMITF